MDIENEKPTKEAQIEFRLDQMGARQETIQKILATKKNKEIFFNVLYEEEFKPNELLLQLAEDYHQCRLKTK